MTARESAVAVIDREAANDVDEADGLPNSDGLRFVKMIALGVCAGGMAFMQDLEARRNRGVGLDLAELPRDDATASADAAVVMTADEVAAFLGVDRKTVYDYAGRGVIPCQRLGKRLLFSRAALVSWLASCRSQGSSNGDTT